MAKQKGIVSLIGTIDGLNFYERNGKKCVRKAGGGFTADKIKKSNSMVRVRENGSEFGNVSRFKKRFRELMFPFFGSYADTTLHGRLMSLFQAIKVCDTTSVRGARMVGVGLTTVEGKLLLERFGFTSKSVQMVFPGKMVYQSMNATLAVTGFDAKAIKFPLSAHVMELQFGVLTLDALHMPSQIYMSSPQYFDAQSSVVAFEMTPNELPIVPGVAVAVIGVRFYEVVNGERYLLKTLSTQRIEVLAVCS
jgi:hypothetical protein